jgi:hypothetical protein
VWYSERITENLSASFAVFGRISASCVPATLVAVGLNGPRTSAGALGFGSNVSICDGAPTSIRKMQFTSPSLPPLSAAFADRKPGSVRPSGASAPACRKSRRDGPLHRFARRGASSWIMGIAPKRSRRDRQY